MREEVGEPPPIRLDKGRWMEKQTQIEGSRKSKPPGWLKCLKATFKTLASCFCLQDTQEDQTEDMDGHLQMAVGVAVEAQSVAKIDLVQNAVEAVEDHADAAGVAEDAVALNGKIPEEEWISGMGGTPPEPEIPVSVPAKNLQDWSESVAAEEAAEELTCKFAFVRVGIEAHRAEKHENARNLNWGMIQNGQEDQSNSADNKVFNAKDAISNLHIPIAECLESEDICACGIPIHQSRCKWPVIIAEDIRDYSRESSAFTAALNMNLHAHGKAIVAEFVKRSSCIWEDVEENPRRVALIYLASECPEPTASNAEDPIACTIIGSKEKEQAFVVAKIPVEDDTAHGIEIKGGSKTMTGANHCFVGDEIAVEEDTAHEQLTLHTKREELEIGSYTNIPEMEFKACLRGTCVISNANLLVKHTRALNSNCSREGSVTMSSIECLKMKNRCKSREGTNAILQIVKQALLQAGEIAGMFVILSFLTFLMGDTLDKSLEKLNIKESRRLICLVVVHALEAQILPTAKQTKMHVRKDYLLRYEADSDYG